MIVCNLFGGPGAGKSTSAAALYAEMKMQGYSVEYVNEYAKQMVYEDKGHWLVKAADFQVMLTAQQLHRMWILREHVDYVIMDSPLILPVLYVDPDWTCYNEFTTFIIKLFKSYNNINFFLNRPARFESGGRVHNEEEAKAVDDRIKTLMSDIGEPMLTIDADREAAVKMAKMLR